MFVETIVSVPEAKTQLSRLLDTELRRASALSSRATVPPSPSCGWWRRNGSLLTRSSQNLKHFENGGRSHGTLLRRTKRSEGSLIKGTIVDRTVSKLHFPPGRLLPDEFCENNACRVLRKRPGKQVALASKHDVDIGPSLSRSQASGAMMALRALRPRIARGNGTTLE